MWGGMSCFRKNFNSFHPVEFEYTIKDKGLTVLLPPGTLLASLLGKVQTEQAALPRARDEDARVYPIVVFVVQTIHKDPGRDTEDGELGGLSYTEEPWNQDPWHPGAVGGHRRKPL